MKKSKLNAVLASVLSLGVVCSGCSVYAARAEEPTIPVEPLAPVGLYSEENKAEIIKEEFEEYKTNREVLVRKIESSKEKVDDEELNGLASYFDDILYEVLKELGSLSKHWSPEINELFCGCSWECIPQINCEFVSMAKDENTCGLLEEILNNICDVVDILPEEFESEKTLFSILREIFYEVGKITEIFVENNKLI